MEPLSPSQREAVRRIVAQMKSRPGPLLEIPHAVQGELGFMPGAAVPLLAEELNLARAEVHGVVTFYHLFRHTPPGRHIVAICRAESCQSMGAQGLAEHAMRRLGVGFQEMTADGVFSLASSVLPRQRCVLAGRHDRRRASRARHAAAPRGAGARAVTAREAATVCVPRDAGARVGVIDPESLEDYVAHGGYRGRDRALSLEPAAIVPFPVQSALKHFPEDFRRTRQ